MSIDRICLEVKLYGKEQFSEYELYTRVKMCLALSLVSLAI
jgi:hypothetical protein